NSRLSSCVTSGPSTGTTQYPLPSSGKATATEYVSVLAKPLYPTLACPWEAGTGWRSEEHTSELQSQSNIVCRLLLEKKKNKNTLPPDLLGNLSLPNVRNNIDTTNINKRVSQDIPIIK